MLILLRFLCHFRTSIFLIEITDYIVEDIRFIQVRKLLQFEKNSDEDCLRALNVPALIERKANKLIDANFGSCFSYRNQRLYS